MNPELVSLLEKGFAAQQQGDLRAAEKAYLKVLKRDRSNEFALNLLAVVCVRTERFDDAVGFLNRALSVNSGDPETHNNLGLAYKGLNRFVEAQSAFERSLQANPQQPATHNNLGNVFASTDRHAEAISCFETALGMDAGYVDCLNNLSMSLKEVGRLEHALSAVDHALRIDGQNSVSHNNRGEVLLQATRYEEAQLSFQRAVAIDGNIVAQINLSTVLKQLGDVSEAVATLDGVLRLEDSNAEAWNHLGVLQEQLGDTARAAECFRHALRHVPNHASSFYQLSKLKDVRLSNAEMRKIRSLLDDANLLDLFKSSLYFALACEYEKQKDYSSSIDYFARAKAVKASRSGYDESAMVEHIRLARKTFPVENAGRAEEVAGPTPIFIVGMPRSGTTLTEQIISTHSEVTGAGELGFINDMAKQATEMTGQPYPLSMKSLTAQHIATLRAGYLQRLVERVGSNRFIVDKNPLNFNFVGLIASVFPTARIIYCRRDPMDNCVSIFRLPFDDNQTYSHDLAALGHYYRQHEELMGFWMQIYGDRMLTVTYEDTVDNLEREARRLLKFIGVEFESEVLSFYENKRIVMTPSAEQVRQPIYRTSIQAWKRYGDALQPLQAALGVDSV